MKEVNAIDRASGLQTGERLIDPLRHNTLRLNRSGLVQDFWRRFGMLANRLYQCLYETATKLSHSKLSSALIPRSSNSSATAISGTPYFTENPGDRYRAYDGSVRGCRLATQAVAAGGGINH